jgi:uncharacterized protein YecE (DUF72 family)
LSEWVEALEKVASLRIPIYAYANNHYAGFGPATVEMFRKLWNATSEQKLLSIEERLQPSRQAVKPASGRLFE